MGHDPAVVDRSIPMEWRACFAYLLNDYSDVISKGKTNLGRSEMVIHDIELMDRTLVYTKLFPLPLNITRKLGERSRNGLRLGSVS
jgi:hypothetical protein